MWKRTWKIYGRVGGGNEREERKDVILLYSQQKRKNKADKKNFLKYKMPTNSCLSVFHA